MPPTATALERTMRVQEVMLQVMAGKLTWIQAAEVLGVSARTMRRYRWRIEQQGTRGCWTGAAWTGPGTRCRRPNSSAG